MTILHNPKNTQQIDCVWAVLSVDEGGHGIVTAPTAFGTTPLVTGKKDLVETWLVPNAQAAARLFNKRMIVAKFSNREQIMEFTP